VSVELADAEPWIRGHVEPVGPIEHAYEAPWSTVFRVPVADGVVWFKVCGPVMAFEPRLSAELGARWHGRVAEVLAHDEERAWLLLADAGQPIGAFGNPPEAWLQVLPGYAELQRGEITHAEDHLEHGVPDLRIAALPARYEDFLRHELPLDEDEIATLRRFEPRFEELCSELAAHGIPESIQHDDLHHANVYKQGDELRVLDWGDSCIGHPFASLVVTFRFLEGTNKLPPADPWFTRIRDAYLEPWGPGLNETCALAIRVGTFAHSIAWARQRDHLPEQKRPDFDPHYADLLRRAIRLTG
jgi:hypothetical protein